MIKVKSKGNFSGTDKFFKNAKKRSKLRNPDEIAKACVERLKEVTPIDSGKTADSWDYEIEKNRTTTTIIINNGNVVDGVKVALMIEYGHLSKNGTWIEGEGFIEPVVRETYNEILNKTWKELTGR